MTLEGRDHFATVATEDRDPQRLAKRWGHQAMSARGSRHGKEELVRGDDEVRHGRQGGGTERRTATDGRSERDWFVRVPRRAGR